MEGFSGTLRELEPTEDSDVLSTEGDDAQSDQGLRTPKLHGIDASMSISTPCRLKNLPDWWDDEKGPRKRANRNLFQLCDSSFDSDTEKEGYGHFSFPEQKHSIGRHREQFLIGEELGGDKSNRRTKVFLSTSKMDRRKYAIKMIKIEKNSRGRDRQGVLNEVYANAVVSGSPCIVQYFDSWYEQLDLPNEPNKLFIQTEYCEGGSLAKKISPESSFRSEEILTSILRQMVLALSSLHSKNICHLDIKPDNILIVKEGTHEFKLADFGQAASSVRKGVVLEGDGRYCPQELMDNQGIYHPSMLKACDVFSLGATLYAVGRGVEMPRKGDEKQFLAHLENVQVLQGLEKYSSELSALICQMMLRDPLKRPTVDQLLSNKLLGIDELVQLEHRLKLTSQNITNIITSPVSSPPAQLEKPGPQSVSPTEARPSFPMFASFLSEEIGDSCLYPHAYPIF